MYTPLNIKTENSLLKSIIKIDELITFAQENSIKSLTITDNKMYGAYEFYKKCKENNIKPIIGLEITINENIIILYAKNYEGYKNLLKLSSIENIENKDLKKYSSNLICILPYKSTTDIEYETIYYGFKDEEEKEKIKNENKIYMGEILCIKKEDQVYLKYIESIKTGEPLKNIQEKTDKYLNLDSALYTKNNYEIEKQCNLEIELKTNLLPKYKTPNNETQYDYLKHLCIEGLKRIFGTTTKQIYIDRLKYELEIINKMGFNNYFLIVQDYVKYAKEHDILVGPGRGSAAGSLVAYTLDITTIDPIRYNLLFERFLNPERITMPDIDIDFEYTKRDEMINYCIKKYGEKSVAPIITFGTLGAKQAIRDVGKTLEIPPKTIDRLCKEIDSSKTLMENLKIKKIKDILETDKNLLKLYKIATRLEGLKRHTSIHAAGIVMCERELDEIIPLEKTHDYYITGYTMEYLEEQGLLKMDFLALKTLTLINDITKEAKINFDEIPLNDQKTIKLFQEGNTNGIFQFESTGMINLLKRIKPNSIEELFAIIALYRPGPMDNIDTYIKRKTNKEKIDYIIDDLEPILKSTYGIIIYQEQIMQIAQKLAGYTLGESDILRRAMSKKKESILIKEKDKFISQSIKNGYNEENSKKVYDLILKFASYGFNKAHSVAYATISYKMAYLKVHYPLIFMKHLLSNNIGSETKTKEYIYICKTMGLNILKPDINQSGKTYEIIDNNIIYPLSNIKGIGIITVEKILENKPYKDIFDFIKRCKDKNKSVIETLIYAGCFENLGYNKKTLIENLENILNYSELGDLLEDKSLLPIIQEYEEFESTYIMEKELELFGFYLSNHPITKFKIKYNSINIKEIPSYFDKNIDIVVYIDRIKELTTKNNEKMCFATVSDEMENIDAVFFPKIYNDVIQKHNILYLNAKVEKRYDKYQLVVNKIIEIIK